MSIWGWLCIGISICMVAILIISLIAAISIKRLKRKKEIERASKCPYEINIYD